MWMWTIKKEQVENEISKKLRMRIIKKIWWKWRTGWESK